MSVLMKSIGYTSMAKDSIVWQPQPGPQSALVECTVPEIMYGGARGGGKSDGMIGKNAIKADRYPGGIQKGCFFRKELPQLEAAIERTKQIYYPLGWKWQDQKKTFTAPNGSTLKFRSLERDSDAEKYQGQDFTDLYFEELTNWAMPTPIDRLRATLRSAAGVPCQMHATCNPGGPGHNWVRAKYISPAPQGYKIIRDDHGNERVFIPAKVSDNKILTDADPGYIARLKQSGSEALVAAWLDGNWDIVEGAYFDCWNPSMVVRPFEIPEEWTKFVSFDWGSAAPFSVGFWAVIQDDTTMINGTSLSGQSVVGRRGALVRYREWYGSKSPNVGLKLTAEEVSAGIRQMTKEKINYWVADPSIFSQDGGPSIAERMTQPWQPADNKRTARMGQVGGWDQMRSRMVHDMLFCFTTCTDSIRTIPTLQHDKNKPEDLDTAAEDHAADEWRYACMSRPFAAPVPVIVPVRDRWDSVFKNSDHETWKTA